MRYFEGQLSGADSSLLDVRSWAGTCLSRFKLTAPGLRLTYVTMLFYGIQKSCNVNDAFLRRVVSVAIFATIAGCGASPAPPRLPDEVVKALEGSSSITLYSIQPWGGPDLPEWDFHGHHQNGHLELKQQQAKQAIAALNDAIAKGNAGLESLCLINPRHALRVISSGNTYDILICYECGQLELYKNNQQLPFSGSIGSKPDALNRLLQQSGIPLADDLNTLHVSYSDEAKLALQRAGEGDAKAQELIGKYLISGRGMTKDEDQGIKWLAKSYGTSVDNPDFEVKLGKMFDHSRGSQPDHIRAMTLFRAAAAKGNAEGQYQVGYLYDAGEGIAKNQAEALQWFHKAADQGNPKAQYQLGVFFAKGWIVKQNYSEAMKWFRKAAEQGHPEAMDWIGSIFKEGLGVNEDLGEAYFWFQLAHEYHTFSGTPLINVSAEKKAMADKRVADWKSSHAACPDDCHF
jgi:TPR repeat protein